MKPAELSAQELVERHRTLSEQRAVMRLKATSKTASAKTRKACWAAANTAGVGVTAVEVELYRRLGVQLPAEVTNRAAFIYIAHHKRGKRCYLCSSTGGMGRFLHAYCTQFSDWDMEDQEKVPKLLQMARAGFSVDEVFKEAAKRSVYLCNTCARKDGVEFDKAGKPLTGDINAS
jgi:hypothetical protein